MHQRNQVRRCRTRYPPCSCQYLPSGRTRWSASFSGMYNPFVMKPLRQSGPTRRRPREQGSLPCWTLAHSAGDLRSHLRDTIGRRSRPATDGRQPVAEKVADPAGQASIPRRAWADVTKAVQAVAQIIDPAEDLAATLKVVDRLVRDSQARRSTAEG